MSCDRMELVQRLAVDNSEALEGDAWQEHMESCDECREERVAFSQSLAIFRQLENERVSRFGRVPSWERFSRTLEADWRRWHLFRHSRLPVATAVVATLMVAGISGWVIGGRENGASRITARGEASAPPANREIQPPRIPSRPPRLNYVADQQANPAVRFKARRSGPNSYVFELYSDASPNDASTGVISVRPKQRGEGQWRPPIATRIPEKPVRVEYSVRGSR